MRYFPISPTRALGTGTHLMLEKEDQADGYLQKPFTLSGFKEMVGRVLRASQSQPLDWTINTPMKIIAM